jgi:hypothetical protein
MDVMRPSVAHVWWVRATDALGIVACLAVVAAVVVAAASRLAAPTLGPAQQALTIRVALGGGDVTAPFAVATPAAWLAAVPEGVREAGPAAIRAYLANTLAERRVALGAPFTATLADSRLAADLDALERAVLAPLIEAELVRALEPLGLFDGSRVADWAAELGDAPAMGVAVRPIVGLRTTVTVEQIRGATPRQVGERVVARLAVRFAEGGAPALLSEIEPASWLPVVEAALTGPVAGAIRAAIAAALRAREGELIAAQAEGAEQAQILARLTAAGVIDEARAAAAAADPAAAFAALLGDVAYERGAEGLRAAWPLPDAAPLALLAPLVTVSSRGNHEALTRAAAFLALLALALLALLAAVQRGAAMLLVPAAVLALASVPGALIALAATRSEPPPPAFAEGWSAWGDALRHWAWSVADLALVAVSPILLAPIALAGALLLIAVARALLAPRRRRSRF